MENGEDFRLVKINPALAEEWLATLNVTRTLAPRRVNTLAEAIIRGEWKFDGNSIKFNTKGELIDGQHRLAAIIQAGATVESLVITNMQDDVIDVIDSGRARSLYDNMKMRGIPNASGTTAILVSLFRYENGTYKPALRSQNWTDATFSQVYARYNEDPEYWRRIYNMGHRIWEGSGAIQSAAGLFYHFALALDQEDADHFADQLSLGHGLQENDPAYVLRRMLAIKNPNRPRRNYQHYAYLVKGWNAYREGRPVQVLSYRAGGKKKEELPTLL